MSRSIAPVPRVSIDQVLAVLQKIETVAKGPATAREVLAGVIDPDRAFLLGREEDTSTWR